MHSWNACLEWRSCKSLLVQYWHWMGWWNITDYGMYIRHAGTCEHVYSMPTIVEASLIVRLKVWHDFSVKRIWILIDVACVFWTVLLILQIHKRERLPAHFTSTDMWQTCLRSVMYTNPPVSSKWDEIEKRWRIMLRIRKQLSVFGYFKQSAMTTQFESADVNLDGTPHEMEHQIIHHCSAWTTMERGRK